MISQFVSGDQLDSKSLHERQKKYHAEQRYQTAPIIIAAGLQIPENLGSVLRLADAAGSEQVIFVSDDDITRLLKQIQRTARSAEALVRWEVWSQERFLQSTDALLPLIAVELTTTSLSIFENKLPEKCGLVIGSEQHGIPAPILAQCQRAVHIPMYGVNGSMNVTHALAIALFEWRRQHSKL